MKDKFGNELHEGDRVVFLHNFHASYSSEMLRATVTGFSGEQFVCIEADDERANEPPSRYRKAIPRKILAERCVACRQKKL